MKAKKRFPNPLILLAVLLILLGSCSDDSKDRIIDGEEDAYQDLKDKDDVLVNFELAYNNRNIDAYRQILDEDLEAFVFVFDPADLAAGKTPDQWGYQRELEVTGRMFTRGGSDPVSSIGLSLTYPEGDAAWVEAAPPSGYESEHWFEKAVLYNLTVKTTSGTTYYAVDHSALFVIRYRYNSHISTSPADSVWQVVQYYDLGS
jgi:hypothetical protein